MSPDRIGNNQDPAYLAPVMAYLDQELVEGWGLDYEAAIEFINNLAEHGWCLVTCEDFEKMTAAWALVELR